MHRDEIIEINWNFALLKLAENFLRPVELCGSSQLFVAIVADDKLTENND